MTQAIASHQEEPVSYHNLVLASECVRDVGPSRIDAALGCQINAQMLADLEEDLLSVVTTVRRRIPRRPNWLRFVPSLKSEEDALRAALERKSAVIQALARAGGGIWSQPYGEPQWIEIPAGTFWMREGESIHQFHLDAFSIACVPITNAQYKIFVRETAHRAPYFWNNDRALAGQESHPVVGMEWHDAMAYCEWLGQVTGQRLTLPTEAQWMRATRGAKDRRTYRCMLCQ